MIEENNKLAEINSSDNLLDNPCDNPLGKKLNADLVLIASVFNNEKDKDGKTPLHVAAQEGHDHNVELILKYGPKFTYEEVDKNKYTPMHFAALNGHIKIVEVLLKFNMDLANKIAANGLTPLHLAAYQGHIANL